MCCCQNTPLQTVTVQFLCTFSVHIITVTHNVLLSEHTVTDRHSSFYVRSVCTTLLLHTMCCCQNTPLQTVTVQFVMFVQCAQHYCNTQCVAVRTHRYRPSHYSLLCTFSVHNITVTHNVLLSEHTARRCLNSICYVRSVCTNLL